MADVVVETRREPDARQWVVELLHDRLFDCYLGRVSRTNTKRGDEQNAMKWTL